MCTKERPPTDQTLNKPPPYVLALQDYDPHQNSSAYDDQPTCSVPNISTQLSFNRGDVLKVVSDVLDWWLLCEKADTKQQGYVATKCCAPICSSSTESLLEKGGDESDEKTMVPCVDGQYVDLSYFPHAPDIDGVQVKKKPSPLESANIFSRLTFWWMTGLILTGYRRPLTDHDVWDLGKDNVANNVVSEFQEKWEKQIRSSPKTNEIDNSIGSSCDSGIENRGEDMNQIEMEIVKSANGPAGESKHGIIEDEGKAKVVIKDGKLKDKAPSMWCTLAQCFGSTFLFAAVMKLFHDALLFINPYLLRLIIQYIEGRGPQETWRGYILALGLFIVATIQSMFLHQYFDKAVIVGLRARSAILGIVYRKMLKLSSKGRQIFTSGEMVNLMSVDATKFQDITTYLNMVWSAPFQILTTLFFLYNLMGWSIFAGVGTMSLLLPINYVVSNKIKSAQVPYKAVSYKKTRISTESQQRLKFIVSDLDVEGDMRLDCSLKPRANDPAFKPTIVGLSVLDILATLLDELQFAGIMFGEFEISVDARN